MSTEGAGVWAYAIIRRESAESRVAGLHGVGDEPVRVVAAAGLAAAVGTVGMGEFGEHALRRNLEDLDWLAAKARVHDAVISAVARFGPVIPVRMATIYLDHERVRRLLGERREEFLATLDWVTGRWEFGVRAFADATILGERPDSRPGGTTGRSGTAYLLRRKRELAAKEEAYRTAAAAAARIHADLCERAVQGKRKAISDRGLAGRDSWTVLNGAYLVNQEDAEDFRSAVSGLGRETVGIELEVSGPWPPYSFAGDVIGRE